MVERTYSGGKLDRNSIDWVLDRTNHDYGNFEKSQYHEFSKPLARLTSEEELRRQFEKRLSEQDEATYTQSFDNRSEALIEAAEMEGPWSTPTVLSLDGGGLRGTCSLLIIQALMAIIASLETSSRPAYSSSGSTPQLVKEWVRDEMQRLNNISRSSQTTDSSDSKAHMFLPCHYFDYIAGSSTSGIIATMLGRMWMSADRALEEFEVLAQQVYSLRWRSQRRRHKVVHAFGRQHDSKEMKKLVKDHISSDIPLSSGEEDRCQIIVCSFQQTSRKQPMQSHLFTSYPSEPQLSDRSGRVQPFMLTEIVRATALSPYFLDSQRLGKDVFFDTALDWPNPTSAVIEEIHRKHRRDSDASRHERPVNIRKSNDKWVRSAPPSGDIPLKPLAFVLSIGCGYTKLSEEALRDPTHHKRPSVRDTMSKTSAKVNYRLALLANDIHEFVEARQESYNMRYVRLNADLDLAHLDEKDFISPEEQARALQRATREQTETYLKTEAVQARLRDCAKLLVELRQMRCTTAQWQSYAFGIRYKCTAPEDCHCKGSRFNMETLQKHLEGAPHNKKRTSKDDGDDIRMLVDKGRVYSDELK